jgi:hypothetical protein
MLMDNAELLTERVLARRVLARFSTAFICAGLPRLALVWRIVGEERRVSENGEVAGN